RRLQRPETRRPRRRLARSARVTTTAAPATLFGSPNFTEDSSPLRTMPAATTTRRSNMRVTRTLWLPMISLLLTAAGAGCQSTDAKDAPYHPAIDPAHFQTKVDNPYFPLVPGTTMKYVETSDGRTSENEVTVTHDTKTIIGVKCLVVHDVVKKDGRVEE